MARERTTDKFRRVISTVLSESNLANKSLVVGVSGGSDSMALLDSLYRARERFNLKLHPAHINHGLDGESDEISDTVREKFVSLGLSHTLQKVDTLRLKGKLKLSEEDAARRVRYSFLSQIAREVQADAIAIGHTADDQAETVLLHLLRGSGLSGISGMRVLSKGNLGRDMPWVTIFRPLLTIRKFETEAYCQSLGVDFIEDLSNRSFKYRRNQLRHQIIPYLEQFNPRVVEALCRLAVISSGYLDLAVAEADRVWDQVTDRQSGQVTIVKETFLRQAPVVQQEVVRKAIKEVLGDLRDVNYGHIQEVVRLISGAPGKMTYLPDDLVFATDEARGYFDYR